MASILFHVCILSVLAPIITREQEPIEVGNVENESNFVVETTYDVEEDTPVEPLPEPEPELAKLEEPEPPEPEPEKPEEPAEPQKEPELRPIDRKIVEQVTNEEVPTEAKYLSDQANKVEEETRAREVTLEDAVPSNEKDPEPPEMTNQESVPTPDAQEMAALAPQEQRPRPAVEPREAQPETEVREQEDEELPGRDPVIIKDREKPNPRRLLIPDASAYEEVFAQRDETVREHSETHVRENKKRLMPGYGELTKNVRQSLENNIYEVKPGNHTGVNAYAAVWASYVGAIHRKIHVRWANGYLMDLDLREPVGSPLNDANLNALLEFVIRAEDGEVEAVNIVRSSGQLRFDAQAVTIAYQIGPHPNPPKQIVSRNGKVYIHWNFWRDQRQCGTFGASVFLVDSDEG